jgi:hypothetical protein
MFCAILLIKRNNMVPKSYSPDVEETKSEVRQEKIESSTFDIAFRHDGKNYVGWVTPSEKLNEEGRPRSFHVVLNDVFFGTLSFYAEKWESDTQREDGLVQATGLQIAKAY